MTSAWWWFYFLGVIPIAISLFRLVDEISQMRKELKILNGALRGSEISVFPPLPHRAQSLFEEKEPL